MKNSFKAISYRVKSELKECHITWKVAFAFIPIAFLSYLFHEFGHWLVGELLGNEMTYGLNSSNAKSGILSRNSDQLFISIGGPAFTIFQALFFMLIVKNTKSIFAYSIVFFAVFSRYFSLIFGQFNQQDETRISAILNLNEYIIPIIVLSILLLILWKSNRYMNFKFKAVGYFTSLSVFANLLVIAVINLTE